MAEVLTVLERRAEDFKDWEKALKDAEKKRTALDAVMAKVRTVDLQHLSIFLRADLSESVD